jgi:hemerythrin superfamily protein
MANALGHPLGRLAAGAAVGFVAGLALPHARKAVMQAPSLAAGDWVDALEAEHRLVEGLFRRLLRTTERQTGQREMLLTKIAYALTKHAVEEENVIYPALTQGGRQDRTQGLIDEHAQIKTFIYDLRRLPPGTTGWLDRARQFHAAVAEHVREEEQEIFPAFRDLRTDDANARLTRMLNWEGFKVA